MSPNNPDAIAVIAIGVNADRLDSQVRHISDLIKRNGFKVVPYGTESWQAVIIDVAGRIVDGPVGAVFEDDADEGISIEMDDSDFPPVSDGPEELPEVRATPVEED